MKITPILSLVAASSVALLTQACSSSPPDAKPEAAVVLDGIFQPVIIDEGATIAEIEFQSTRYYLVPVGCDDLSCSEQGTFTFDRSGRRLNLVADGGGKTYALPLDAITTARGSAQSASSPRAAGLGGVLRPAGETLLEGESETLLETIGDVVASFQLFGRDFNRLETDQNGESEGEMEPATNKCAAEGAKCSETATSSTCCAGLLCSMGASSGACIKPSKWDTCGGTNVCGQGQKCQSQKCVSATAPTACSAKQKSAALAECKRKCASGYFDNDGLGCERIRSVLGCKVTSGKPTYKCDPLMVGPSH